MTNDTNDILGLMGETDETDVPAMPTLNFNLSLTEEDLDSGPVYKPIPKGTRADFEVYSVEQKPWTNKHGVATVKWEMVFKVVEDTWGVGKQIRHTVRFQPVESFNWGPFLKAIGLIEGAGDVDMKIFEDGGQSAEGRKFSAKVLGYQWRDEQGNYLRDHGKQGVVKPSDVEKFYEELGYFEKAKGLKSDEGDVRDDQLADSAEFSTTEYL